MILFNTGQNPPRIPHELRLIQVNDSIGGLEAEKVPARQDSEPNIVMRAHPAGGDSKYSGEQRRSDNDAHCLADTQSKSKET